MADANATPVTPAVNVAAKLEAAAKAVAAKDEKQQPKSCLQWLSQQLIFLLIFVI